MADLLVILLQRGVILVLHDRVGGQRVEPTLLVARHGGEPPQNGLGDVVHLLHWRLLLLVYAA